METVGGKHEIKILTPKMPDGDYTLKYNYHVGNNINISNISVKRILSFRVFGIEIKIFIPIKLKNHGRNWTLSPKLIIIYR